MKKNNQKVTFQMDKEKNDGKFLTIAATWNFLGAFISFMVI